MNRVPSDGIPVPAEALRGLVRALAERAGAREAQAALLADLLVGNDLRGVFSHGSRQIAAYARDLRDGKLNPRPRVRTVDESVATLLLDGDAGLGGIFGVAVKKSLGYELALHLSPAKARRLIKEVAAEACRNLRSIEPLRLDPPYTLEIRRDPPPRRAAGSTARSPGDRRAHRAVHRRAHLAAAGLMGGHRLWVTGPYQVALEPFELPDAPGPGQVLLETERTLVSAGTELAIVMGTHIGFQTGAGWPSYPTTLGYTAVGRVLRVGAEVTGFAAGERVLAATRHATHAHAPAGSLLRVPDGCSPEAALLAHLASVPMTGIRLARPQLGEGAALFGQGLIGALGARLARAAGCRPVLGVDLLAERRAVAATAGIVPVDPREADPAGVYRGLTGGRAPEIVVEATGAPEVIAEALRVAGEMARVVLLGSPRGRVEIDPYTDVHRKGVTIIGAHHPTMTPRVATPFAPFTQERNREAALALVADGSLSTEGLVSHHARPEEAAGVYRAPADRSPGYMGVVIDWNP